MTTQNTHARVLDLIALHTNKCGVHFHPRTEQQLTSLGLDSLDIVELIMHIEEAFGIHLDHDSFASWTTVGQIVTEVKNALGEQNDSSL